MEEAVSRAAAAARLTEEGRRTRVRAAFFGRSEARRGLTGGWRAADDRSGWADVDDDEASSEKGRRASVELVLTARRAARANGDDAAASRDDDDDDGGTAERKRETAAWDGGSRRGMPAGRGRADGGGREGGNGGLMVGVRARGAGSQAKSCSQPASLSGRPLIGSFAPAPTGRTADTPAERN